MEWKKVAYILARAFLFHHPLFARPSYTTVRHSALVFMILYTRLYERVHHNVFFNRVQGGPYHRTPTRPIYTFITRIIYAYQINVPSEYIRTRLRCMIRIYVCHSFLRFFFFFFLLYDARYFITSRQSKKDSYCVAFKTC